MTTAVSAAAALGGAHVDASLEGGKASHDSPIVNLEEGNVLLEMAYAMDVLEEAHGDNNVVPRLISRPATRHVLAPVPRAAAVAAEVAPTGAGAPGVAATTPTS